MALWLVRAGKYGEHEPRFFQDNRVYLTWEEFTGTDLSVAKDYEGIKSLMQQQYPGEPARRIGNWSGQVWAFVLATQLGDWVVVPRKSNGSIAVGEVKSGYTFDPGNAPMYRHYRTVQWLNTDVPRSSFDQDLLYSLGAIMTVCEIKRNDAEKRIRAMSKNGWHSVPVAPVSVGKVAKDVNQPDDEAEVDLEQLARDAIARVIIQKFKGHGMARLVEAVLKAQGFTTYLSPEGPDKGIDILAAGGAFGFDSPRICVQVKSGDTPADRPEFTQLIGAMQSVSANQGLFVSWSGFKPTVLKEVPTQFFKVRVWNQEDLIEKLLENYEKLDQDIQAELPLKRIWTISLPES
ncbi:restriction endonuclease [Malikia spinosa]|uniref:Restriction endonuclease n=1 Tax=Malikia spinosa TaxID=86180 RepID=A0A2S9KFI4_9BURK|nr:restriction endonuclease [Malikia spinosa]PRD69202.1 restriction endonuclease [Malikia spinosa]